MTDQTQQPITGEVWEVEPSLLAQKIGSDAYHIIGEGQRFELWAPEESAVALAALLNAQAAEIRQLRAKAALVDDAKEMAYELESQDIVFDEARADAKEWLARYDALAADTE